MIVLEERGSEMPNLTPREAAWVTGLSEKTIQQAIDRDEVRAIASARERTVSFPDIVYLRLRDGVGQLLSPEGRRRLRDELGRVLREEDVPDAVTLGPVGVNVGAELQAVRNRIAELERMRSVVSVDPLVRAGEPVVLGTRVSVHVIADLARQGVSEDDLLEDFPSLTPESLEAALLYARMYPRRGRPRRAPWADPT